MKTLALTLLPLLASCAPKSEAPASADGTFASVSLTDDELGSFDGKAVQLSGALFVYDKDAGDADRVLLCETVLETFPPRCGGNSVSLDGADLDALALSASPEHKLRWSNGVVWAQGQLRGDRLDVVAMHASKPQ